ncbi:MAG: GHMP kinase [Flavobacteriaceae bacterium CG_4_8_14_3_um_filter_34_10]|nr:MAG: GHMP kinase [Flavobacteriaceae bacterium CG2_30_34_30]PIV51637.1 MAG: GHMP kinase [Flavobacteriaceae bacterium CG02_land_8_20_14_3_00_34_13]PIX10665.1 MAG: GHMP kinase [Flavobacteriaceae bacterium CG_4_8_14_3_um_filter_34_10]
MKTTFYGNGKLLLTSEYLVLDGAKALAIPTKYGQYLEVEKLSEKVLLWKSLDEHNRVWFDAIFNISNDSLELFTEKNEVSETLLFILQQTKKLNPSFLLENKGYQITTKLNFSKNWGLGTSSTLISTIAAWAKVDAFTLLKNSFGGSGYDIACAIHDKPILFSNNEHPPIIEEVVLPWDFKDELFFVYLNKKQDSKQAIGRYKNLNTNKKEAIVKVNALTQALISSKTLSAFENLLQEHEEILSNLLQLPKVKKAYFKDYPGIIKSLGAWGGDFVLATSKEALDYFPSKGYSVIIPFTTMLK